jgi:hypothetical protein
VHCGAGAGVEEGADRVERLDLTDKDHLATILKNKELFAGQRIGVIITGGNVDLDKLPWKVSLETLR